MDQGNINIMTITYGLFFNLPLDYALLIYNEIYAAMVKKNKLIAARKPVTSVLFPRFLALFIKDAMKAHKLPCDEPFTPQYAMNGHRPTISKDDNLAERPLSRAMLSVIPDISACRRSYKNSLLAQQPRPATPEHIEPSLDTSEGSQAKRSSSDDESDDDDTPPTSLGPMPTSIPSPQPRVMDANNANFVASDTSKKNKPKLVWDNTTFMVFIDLCMNEVKNGNRPGSHFNKLGWGNIEKKIKERIGKSFDKKQLKNKWDTMKKEWKLYDRLMRIESGIGWDLVRKTIVASPEWWDEKIKGDKDLPKFRDLNLKIYQVYYEPLFWDSVAIGDEEDHEGKGDSAEVNLGDDNKHLFPQSSPSKRKKPNNVALTHSTKGKSSITSSFEDKLDNVLEALSSRSTQTFSSWNKYSPTTQECMNIVTCFPGFEGGSRMYSQALRIFLKKQVRENFMVPKTHMARMKFFKLLMEE
ncbi:L10-interacting MYB domain-containing protein-like [Cynara cardunculus var. scolymus]|uniref:L10-interacting MYB domain-containing protein-like n=1 Tax=Cynara cardunculus var. scolymus TaxID=59895 RepID=UPI000D62C7B7|nr:L10-interacting MYB domain-containing protein-like [Cynara cardunculus var. scolymus]